MRDIFAALVNHQSKKIYEFRDVEHDANQNGSFQSRVKKLSRVKFNRCFFFHNLLILMFRFMSRPINFENSHCAGKRITYRTFFRTLLIFLKKIF